MMTFGRMLVALFAIFTSIAFGLYVYPDQPVLIWGMLAFLWACYRLRMRAVTLFAAGQRLQKNEAESALAVNAETLAKSGPAAG